MTKTGFGDFTLKRDWKFIGMTWITLASVSMCKMVADVLERFSISRENDKRNTTLTNAFRTKKDFELFDIDGNGYITETEWLVTMLARLKLVHLDDIQVLRSLFRVLDRDGGGCIDMEELSAFWKAMNDEVTNAQKH